MNGETCSVPQVLVADSFKDLVLESKVFLAQRQRVPVFF
jgi:hypothetical protein